MFKTLLLLAVLAAQPSGPQDLTITGPDTASTDDHIILAVEGLPALDMEAKLGEAIKWVSNIRTDCISPKESTPRLRSKLFMTPPTWGMDLELAVDKPGVYDVLVIWHEAPFGHAVHRVTVGGEIPLPIPPPVTTKADQVTIVSESTANELTKDQLEITNGKEVRDAAKQNGLSFQYIDPNVSGADLSEVQYVIEACKGLKTPRLVLSLAGKVIYNEPLPSNVSETVAILLKYGTHQ